MKIIIAGDLVPTESNIELFKRHDFIKNLNLDFQKIWCEADFRVFNLECPLYNNRKPIKKTGPNLSAPIDTINGIKSLNPSLILLANNHILDHGEDGLKSTVDTLSKNNINYTGIINNNSDEMVAHYFEKENKKVGIYNLCENEFTVAGKNSRGANPYDGIKNYLEIKKTKKKCDYLIVVFHGGKEFYRYPSPNLQKICRQFIDFGADFVVTQHSHCIGCYEEYKDKKILYGQGNFIFDSKNDEYWNSSLLTSIEINEGKFEVTFIPLEKQNNLIKISNNKQIMNDFEERSKEILRDSFIEDNYNRFALENLNEYLKGFHHASFFGKVLNRIFQRKYYEKIYNLKDYLIVLNSIRCEAHRELVMTALKLKIEQEDIKNE